MMQSARERLRVIAKRAMVEHGLEPEFSPAAMSEAKGFSESARPAATIRDLRHLLWCSIDNDDSRDLDQLSVADPKDGGVVNVMIAISDVDALVRHGTAIDRHAQTNTTSVYTEGQIFPMLPERLSTDLTSLNEGEDRLAIVVELPVCADGDCREGMISRAVVRNRAKLAYPSVAAWLDGEAPPPPKLAAVQGLADQVRLQDRVAQSMRAVRDRHGALSLETLEPKAQFEGELLAGLALDERNRAKELIEDFMIAANGVTAKFLLSKGFPSIRRILRPPERWGRIVEMAARYGGRLPGQPDARALQHFLVEQRSLDPIRFPDLSLSVVKLLGSGEYGIEMPGESPTGHFGLAVRDYAHSTAPNRRFPDLITQRLVKAALADRSPPYDRGELDFLARHCTEQEDNATKVERQVRKSAAALLLANRIGERFDAIVTGASEKGTWARIFRPPAEGKVERGFRGLDVGDRIRVELLSTDVERGFIDFARVGG